MAVGIQGDHPDINLRLKIAGSGDLLRRLEDGEIDVAFCFDKGGLDGRLAKRTISAGPLILVASPRRCIAVDLLAHGDTEIGPDQDVSVTANAKMPVEFLDALQIEQVDLVGNDSGGGIAQIFGPESLACTQPHAHRLRCARQLAAGGIQALSRDGSGGLRDALEAMLADKNIYRSAEALGPAYEHPEKVTDETIEAYLRSLVRTEQRTCDLQRFLAAFDCKHTLAVEAQLRDLKMPTLIVRGTDDIYFDVQWSRWLAEAIPSTRRRIELKDARTFFPKNARWNSIRNCARTG
jgi:pimeloyl-ACP methyl ester carboxylesterase